MKDPTSDSPMNWEAENSFGQTDETEEETDSSLESETDESSWVIINPAQDRIELELQDGTTSKTLETTKNSANTLQLPPNPASWRNPSPGRTYLMKPGFHKQVQIQEFIEPEETQEITTDEAPNLKIVVPGLEMSPIDQDESTSRKLTRGTLSPRKSDSPRRGDSSSKRKTLALSGSSKRKSWSSDPESIALKRSTRTTKSAEYATDDLKKSRNRLSEDGGDETTPRRKLVTSGKYTKKPEKPFWEELDESVDFQKQLQDSFTLLKDQGFGT